MRRCLLTSLFCVGRSVWSPACAFSPPPSLISKAKVVFATAESENVTEPPPQSISSDTSSLDAVPPSQEFSPPPPPPPPQVKSQSQQPSSTDLMRAMGTNPRRIFLSLTTSTSIALAANFLGITSNLLGSVPSEVVESTGLDTYYPVNGFKRFNGSGYTLTIPKEWVADTAVELAKATRRAGTLDYGMKRPGSGAPGAGVLPDAAFGPPGKKDARGLTPQGADTNLSIVISQLRKGFSLRELGPPKDAAEFLIRVSLAPEGSGRVGTLLTASEVRRGGPLYQFEYEVDRGQRGVPLRAISVIGVVDGENLITGTVVAPKADWTDERYATKLRKIIESFCLK